METVDASFQKIKKKTQNTTKHHKTKTLSKGKNKKDEEEAEESFDSWDSLV